MRKGWVKTEHETQGIQNKQTEDRGIYGAQKAHDSESQLSETNYALHLNTITHIHTQAIQIRLTIA